MITCKYCGSELNYIGEHKNILYFYCDYCQLSFDKDDTCFDRKRKSSVPDSYDNNYYKSTKELLKTGTIELFHLLRDCRKDWYDIKKTLSTLYQVQDNEVPDRDAEEFDNTALSLFKEYKILTKQKFIIENIILEKAGFIPGKITEEFLGNLITDGRSACEKPMYIYIKNKRKTPEESK